MKTVRCPWSEKSEEEKLYYDSKWGIPVHDDKKLFKMLILEGMQTGLSWAIILKKRGFKFVDSTIVVDERTATLADSPISAYFFLISFPN